jgi:iron complex outermembrane receptor protein
VSPRALPTAAVVFAVALALARPGAAQDAAVVPPPGAGDGIVPPIEVHAPRPPEPPAGVVRALDPARGERLGAATAADLVAFDPAVSVRRDSRGDRPLFVRGFGGRALRLTIEGVPFELPYEGEAALGALPAAWLAALRVEKGVPSIRDGPSGLGGSLRLDLQRAGEGPRVRALVEHTAREGGRAHGFHAGAAGPARWLVGGGYEHSAGWNLSDAFDPGAIEDGGRRRNSDDRLGHVLARAALDIAPGHRVEALGGWLDRAYGVPPSTIQASPRAWRFTDWQAGLAALRYRGRPAAALAVDAALWLTRFANTLDAYDDLTYRTRSGAGAWRCTYDDLGVGADLLLALDPLSLPVGRLDAALRLDASWLRHAQVPDRAAASETAAVVRLAALPEVRWEWGDHLRATLQGGVEGELPQAAAGQPAPAETLGWRLFAGLEAAPHPRLRLEVGAARTLRLPSPKERYSSAFGARVAAPDLRPEVAWRFHAAVSWRPLPWLAASVTGFDVELRDLIERAVVDVGVEQLRNLGRARLAGVEAALELTPWQVVALRVGHAFLHTRDLTAGGDPLTHRPAHRVVAELRVRPGAGLEATVLWTFTGPQDSNDPFRSEVVRLGATQRLDLLLAWQACPEVALWARVTNVLDADQALAWGFPEPGRTGAVGLEIAGGNAAF